MSVLSGFKEIQVVEVPLVPQLTVTESSLRLNHDTAKALGFPPYVKVFVNERSKRVALQPCKKGEPNAVKFSKPADRQPASVTVKAPRIVAAVRELFPLEPAEDGLVACRQTNGRIDERNLVVLFAAEDSMASSYKPRGRRKAA